MPGVLVFDYDGTLAHAGLLAEPMRAALLATRQAGLATVLLTGRTLPGLLEVCPDALALFDRVVGEGGAVLARAGGPSRLLASPVDAGLEHRLAALGVWRGQVALGLAARHEEAVLRAVGELDLDVRVIRDREELLVLPAAISKVAGLSHALASLGVSEGAAVAFGDGESDVEVLSVCALGVAVAGAVAELRAAADVVLSAPGAEGVVEFVLGIVHSASRPEVTGR